MNHSAQSIDSVQVLVHERKKQFNLKWEGFVKQVALKLVVKEWGRDEWWVVNWHTQGHVY